MIYTSKTLLEMYKSNMEFSVADPGCLSRIRIKDPKLFLCSRKYDPGCLSQILIFYPHPDPGAKKAPDLGSGTLKKCLSKHFQTKEIRWVNVIIKEKVYHWQTKLVPLFSVELS